MVFGGTWQALGLHHGLPHQNEAVFYSFEKERVVPERHKEVVTKRSILDTQPLLGNVINRRMLKIELVDQELLLCRLAVLVAPEGLDFILHLLVVFDGFLGIEAIGPLSCGDSKELFSGVEYLLVVYLDVNV